jgi:sugar phosphate isomerase/epimerase
VAGGVADAYRIMKARIRSTHVHDNDGKVDAHLFPLRGEGGTIDWREAMALLRSGGDQYPLLLELKEKPDIAHPLEAALEVFDKLEAL